MSTIPEGWKLVEVNDLFLLHLPPELAPAEAHAVDSTVGQFESENCSLYYDYGLFSNPLDSYKQRSSYEEKRTEIGGHSAKIVTATDRGGDPRLPYVAAVHFDGLMNKQKLTVHIRCASAADRDRSIHILTSIRFKQRTAGA